MGRKVFPPPSQGNMTDEEYDDYLQGEYRQYLLEGMAQSRWAVREALFTLVAIALITVVLLAVTR